MKTLICNVKRLIVFASLTVISISVKATTISQQPIFLSTGAEPNLMFVMDDSSSMISEIMPESLQIAGYPAYVFPPSVTTFGIKPGGVSIVASLNGSHVYHRVVRSKVNSLYYDPARQYTPWIASDGSLMKNADETCAFHNPVKTDASLRVVGTDSGEVNCRNLVQDVIATTYYASNSDTGYYPRNCRSYNSSAPGPTCDNASYTHDSTQTHERVIRQATAPTSSLRNGDIWINSADDTMKIRYSAPSNGWYKFTISNDAPVSPSNNDIWLENDVVPPQAKQRVSGVWQNIDLVLTYYPATYYRFSGTVTDMGNSGSGVFNGNNYEKVEIRAGSSYSGDGRTSDTRKDCADVSGTWTCTYEQEIQNFANWYTYYRARTLLARGSIGKAFVEIGDSIRIGYGAINKNSADIDGVTTKTVVKNVTKFDSATKTDFLDEVYKGQIPYGAASNTGSTPLRRALEDIGKFYSRDDVKGPWSSLPGTGTAATAKFASCRRSYTILTTDGYWNDSYSGSVGDADSQDGVKITNHSDNSTYQYTPKIPFLDDGVTNSKTLADIAMHYWKTDLLPDVQNKIDAKAGDVDNAFWQHMTTYTVGLGVNGKKVKYPFDGKWSVGDIILDPSKLPSDFTWGDYNLDGNANKTVAEKVDDLIHAAVNGHGGFFSAQDPDTFTDELRLLLKDLTGRESGNASAAAANSTNLSTESVLFKAQFDSNEWTGTLQAVQIDKNGKVAKVENALEELVDKILWTTTIPSSRKIFSSSDSGGISLQWDKLSAAQQTIFQDGSGVAHGQNLLAWFTGELALSDHASKGFRSRANLLGDIVNSDPAYAGSENYQYEKLNAALGGTSYKAFYTKYKYSIDPDSKLIKQRTPMIYVGANDGMLHGFNATDGVEVFAYAPSTLFSKIPDLADTNYKNAHQYYVDGPVYVNDAYIDGEWRTILVGSLGAGGRTIFALDVTDPDNFDEDDVLFEIDEGDYEELGNTLGAAIIAPGSDNRWKIFVGNGYNSTEGGVENAYLGVIDIEDEYLDAATKRTRFIRAGNIGTNGLAQPALLPNASGQISAAFAGDLHGNMWKFDLSSSDYTAWNLAYSGNPLFVARDSGGVTQEITSSPTLGFNLQKSPAVLMVYFGTGKYMATADITDTQTQSFYAVVDKDYTTALVRADMFEKTFDDVSIRKLDSEVVDWTTFDGWYLDFTGGDRVITKPILVAGNLIFPTLSPNNDPCESGGTGWLMELKGVGNKECLLCDAVQLVEPIIGDLILLKGYDESKNELNVFVGENTEGELQAEVTTDENAGLGRHFWRQLQ